MRYDIFISYRRSGGREIARAMKSWLDARGYSVFLDYDELKDGVFDERITQALDGSKVVLLILSPDALDRCVNEEDWVRKEIEYALSKGKHLIPVNPDGKFKGLPAGLPEGMAEILGRTQHSEVMMGQLFQASMKKLTDERIRRFVSSSRAKRRRRNIFIAISVLAVTMLLGYSYLTCKEIESDVSRHDLLLTQAEELMHFEDSLDSSMERIEQASGISDKYREDIRQKVFGNRVAEDRLHCEHIRDSLVNHYRHEFETAVSSYLIKQKETDRIEARRIGDKLLKLKEDANVRNLMNTILI